MRPVKGTYPSFVEPYIAKANGKDLQEALIDSTELLMRTLSLIPDDKGDYSYADGKWTIKQLLIHISDAERIFAYRLLRFARNDQQQPLPFEEDDYAKTCNADKRTLSSVIEELIAVRNATASLIESLQPEDFNKTGNTAAGKTTVNAVGFSICGHCNHHIAVLRDKYL